jgi:hypothetical protein
VAAAAGGLVDTASTRSPCRVDDPVLRRQHAEELVSASTPAYRRSAKRRQLRRGAASFLSVAVVLTALAIAKLCGWHY